MTPELKREPWIARVRKDMADVYRGVRKDSPAMARLLHQRYKAAYEMLSFDFDRRLYNETFGESSLGDLFK